MFPLSVQWFHKAAKRISAEVEVPGFRKGKATYEAVSQNVGELKIVEEALGPIVQKFLSQAIEEEDLATVGQPQVDIEKMAPNNPIVFTAIVSLMPDITKLADYDKLSVDAKATDASDEDVEKALKDLTRMQTKEVRAESGAQSTEKDLVVIDMEMKKEGVVIEGGTGQGYRVYMHEDFYIPGMKEQLVGTKEGDKKAFTVTFPEEHFQKHLAGQPVDCEVEVKEIYTLDAPELDDEFAKTVGMKDAKDLEKKLSENIKNENDLEEKTRQETELLELIADKSTFGEIPESLIDSETEKMMHELQHAVERQGGVFTDYLQSIKKTPDELKAGMRDQGLKRVQVGLVMREVGKKEEVEVTDDELQTELEKQAKFYDENDKRREQVMSPEYREYMKYRLRNQKVIEMLREKMVKSK